MKVKFLDENISTYLSESQEAISFYYTVEERSTGIKISFIEQDRPKGLPDAFIIGEKFIGKDDVVLILGDNFFYGQSLGKKLKECLNLDKGAKIFIHPVANPSLYGVAKINNKKISKIVEKPKKEKAKDKTIEKE